VGAVRLHQRLHAPRSTIAVTMDRYGHLFPDELDRLADGLEVAYRTASSPAAQSAEVRTQVVALR